MASIGHVAVGLAAARLSEEGKPNARSWAAWSALSLLPDADVIGFALGIPYAHPWGHRGATHSLTVAVAIGCAFALATSRFNRSFGRTALVATVALASHPLLDTMTDGGLGCALLWPFENTRYFAPWRPIPVAPIGFSFFSHGGTVILMELVLFAPLFWFAVRRTTAPARRSIQWTILVVWLISTWLLASTDPVRQAVVGRMLREDTAYASGFSERRFRTIDVGDSEADVLRLLGPAVAEGWFYRQQDSAPSSAAETSASSTANTCVAVNFEHDVVVASTERRACEMLGIRMGLTRKQVTRVLGPPPESCWRYTWSPRGARYRLRMVCFREAKVATVFRRWE